GGHNARRGGALIRRFPRNSDAMRLLHGYLRSLERTGFGASVNARAIVYRHLIDLAVLAATTDCRIGESSASAVGAARLSAALDYTAARLEEPGLNIAAVARGQGISPRCLQRLPEGTGRA